uniref:Uncharacterized protein n=1 Tax=Picea sitchensis TaxID=3332 RepID=D5AD43_PICSI|nr:unknown [Picea sitchensis]
MSSECLWDGTFSPGEFQVAAMNLIDKWAMCCSTSRPWRWEPCPKLPWGASHDAKGYLSLEDVLFKSQKSNIVSLKARMNLRRAMSLQIRLHWFRVLIMSPTSTLSILSTTVLTEFLCSFFVVTVLMGNHWIGNTLRRIFHHILINYSKNQNGHFLQKRSILI